MGSPSFAPHGRYRLQAEGALIHLWGRGPVNREAVVQYRQELAELLARRPAEPWGILAHLEGEALLLPDAAELLSQESEADLQRGRVATALVLDNVLLADLVKEQVGRCYHGQRHAVEFFSDLAEAKRWLELQIEQARIGGNLRVGH